MCGIAIILVRFVASGALRDIYTVCQKKLNDKGINSPNAIYSCFIYIKVIQKLTVGKNLKSAVD
jgi:hypothetical protein